MNFSKNLSKFALTLGVPLMLGYAFADSFNSPEIKPSKPVETTLDVLPLEHPAGYVYSKKSTKPTSKKLSMIKKSFPSLVALVENPLAYFSIDDESKFASMKEITGNVMISDLDSKLTLGNYSLDSLFQNLNLNDTTSNGYFLVEGNISPDDKKNKQIYNRHRMVQKSAAEYYSDWQTLNWGRLAPLLGMKRMTPGVGQIVKTDFFTRYGSDIVAIANTYDNLSVADFVSLILAESDANQFALSWSYCVGVGQLSSYVSFPSQPFSGHYSKGVPKAINPLNPVDALSRSALFYSGLLSAYGGNRDLALTAYNAGEYTLNTAISSAKSKNLSDIKNAKLDGEYILSDENKSYATHVKSQDSEATFYVSNFLNSN